MHCLQFAVLVAGKQTLVTEAGAMSVAIFPGEKKKEASIDWDENVEKAIIIKKIRGK
jgi:hypothetical protein